jgi:Acetyltransferase (GNAT) family
MGWEEGVLCAAALVFRIFRDSSYIIELDGQIVAFLIGILSNSHPKESYIHFVGVNPQHR